MITTARESLVGGRGEQEEEELDEMEVEYVEVNFTTTTICFNHLS